MKTLILFVVSALAVETTLAEPSPPHFESARLANCIALASAHYTLPPLLLLAIKYVESGSRLDVQINKNTNGTEDIGLMQINTSWLDELENVGIDRYDLEDSCINITVAAWILNYEMNLISDNESFWVAVGHYHSRKKELSKSYIDKVSAVWQRLQQYESNQ